MLAEEVVLDWRGIQLRQVLDLNHGMAETYRDTSNVPHSIYHFRP